MSTKTFVATVSAMSGAFDEDDRKIVKEYGVPTSSNPSVTTCRVVVTRTGEKANLDSGVYSSGPGGGVHNNLSLEADGKNAEKSNGDAERKAVSEIMNLAGSWDDGKVYNGMTMYVLASRGPCKYCKQVVKSWANKSKLRLVYVYGSKSKTEANGTVGGVNGYEDAEQIDGYWVYVPGAVAKVEAKLEPFTNNAYEVWFKNHAADSMLQGLKKNQKDLLWDEKKKVLGSEDLAALKKVLNIND